MTNFYEIKNILSLISSSVTKNSERNKLLELRKRAFTPQKLKKIAFDTRRINQETQINPRRGLQNYNRSESFISIALSKKLQNLNTLKNALNDIKNQYGKEIKWHDSNARVLLSHLEKALRSNNSFFSRI